MEIEDDMCQWRPRCKWRYLYNGKEFVV